MFRRIFTFSGLTALAVIGSLMVAKPAAAQQGQRLYEWSGQWGSFSGSPSYPSGYEGASSPAGYGTSYAGYPAPEPTYSGGYYGAYPGSSAGYYGSTTPGSEPSADSAVHIAIRVPGRAEIWFEGEKTQQTGSFREFVSPPLRRDRDYRYQVRARWMEGGQVIDRTRDITVHAGEWINLDFTGGPRGQPSDSGTLSPREG